MLRGSRVVQMVKARSEDISAAFLLFPSLCNMGGTPKGDILSVGQPRNPISNDEAKLSSQPFFRGPMPKVASVFSPLSRLLPGFAYGLILPDWPEPQRNILRDLLQSPPAVRACLALANEGMKEIEALDEELTREQQHKLWLYFGRKDGWVGEKNENSIIETLHPDHKADRVARPKVKKMSHIPSVSVSFVVDSLGFLRG